MPKKIILVLVCAAIIAASVLAIISDISGDNAESSLFPKSVSVYISDSDRIEQMSFDKFIEGCICGMLPKTGNIYEEQTLAAMAVVFNTNALVTLNDKNRFSIADFTVCDEFPFVSYTDTAIKLADRKLVQNAIKIAGHSYLANDRKPVKIKMCAISSGKTRELPFMPSKELPEDALAKGYLTERAFTENEILNAFSVINIADKPQAKWFSDPVYDEYGGLVSIELLSKKLSGAEIRSALNLRSDAISVECREETFYFNCKGNGDNAGMSLNAANIAAKNNKTFEEILSLFYELQLVS